MLRCGCCLSKGREGCEVDGGGGGGGGEVFMEEGITCAKGSKVVLIIRGLGGRRHPAFGAGGVPRNSKECLLGVGPRISNGAVGIRARVTPPIRTYRPPSCEEQRKLRRQPPLLPAVREASTVAGPLEGRLCPRLWRDGAPTTPHVASHCIGRGTHMARNYCTGPPFSSDLVTPPGKGWALDRSRRACSCCRRPSAPSCPK